MAIHSTEKPKRLIITKEEIYMGYYKVTITEHLARSLMIEADNAEGALEKAEYMVNSSKVILDADDFLDRDFEVEESSETEG